MPTPSRLGDRFQSRQLTRTPDLNSNPSTPYGDCVDLSTLTPIGQVQEGEQGASGFCFQGEDQGQGGQQRQGQEGQGQEGRQGQGQGQEGGEEEGEGAPGKGVTG